MHEKCFKIDFFAIFRKLQKKLPICKKRYAEILHNGVFVVINVENKQRVPPCNPQFFYKAENVAEDALMNCWLLEAAFEAPTCCKGF